MPAIAGGAILSHLGLLVVQPWLATGTRTAFSYALYLLAATGATAAWVEHSAGRSTRPRERAAG